MEQRNRRLNTMEALDNELEEMEFFSEDVAKYRNLHEEIDELEDEIERYYKEKEGGNLEGTIKEPSLVLCWFIVAVVSLYVVFLGIQGTAPTIVKDEL